jgi:N-terminal acetyltransferase B complex non-catalytic subunit
MDAILKNGDPGKMNPVRLNYLHSPYLGPESTIAKGEWQLWRLKLELLKKDPEVLFQMTGDLLKRARTKNKAGEIAESRFSDWIVWESYIDTALRDKPKYQDQVDAEIKAHLDPKSRIDKSWRRNASLASLKFSLAPDSAFLSSGAHDSKTGLVLQYLQQYGDTNVAYTDLRTVIPLLASQDLDSLLQTLLQDTRGTWDASHSGEGQSMESVGSLNQQVSQRRFASSV